MGWIGPGCLLFTGTFTWILGLASIGLWVGCYYECPSGRDVDFNYYVAVWTGVVAFFAGIFHMVFCCGKRQQYNKPVLWSAACCSFILLPCSLLLTTLSGYLSWREWDTEQKYQEDLADPDVDPAQLQGDYVTGIALFATMGVVGVLLLILTLIFNCYHCCGNSEVDEEEIEISVEPTPHEENPDGRSKSKVTYHQEYYSPPPPSYARESNTQKGPVYNANYNDTRRTKDHSDNYRYQYSEAGTQYNRTGRTQHDRSGGTQYDRTGRTQYDRSGATQYASRSAGVHYNSRSRPPPASYSHAPHADQYRSSPTGRGGGYDFNSQPSGMRWESNSRHIPRENPWSFGPRDDVVGSTRSYHSNYF
ncbi:uncharacterized protein [Amphiura filiformis]|uniref:uncharacterized protein n=1 Tax=Amphiura filiformis TaxID=82378 RepID=UPI003B21F540